jgi:hypothetical protein
MNCLLVLALFPSRRISRKSAGSIQSFTADDKRDSNEPLKMLCIQLFSAGIPSDALLIYKAKMSSFDAGCYIDIQLVCGADSLTDS